jgi:hypothetical protein
MNTRVCGGRGRDARGRLRVRQLQRPQILDARRGQRLLIEHVNEVRADRQPLPVTEREALADHGRETEIDLLRADRADKCVEWIRDEHRDQAPIALHEGGNCLVAPAEVAQRVSFGHERCRNRQSGVARSRRKSRVDGVNRSVGDDDRIRNEWAVIGERDGANQSPSVESVEQVVTVPPERREARTRVDLSRKQDAGGVGWAIVLQHRFYASAMNRLGAGADAAGGQRVTRRVHRMKVMSRAFARLLDLS